MIRRLIRHNLGMSFLFSPGGPHLHFIMDETLGSIVTRSPSPMYISAWHYMVCSRCMDDEIYNALPIRPYNNKHRHVHSTAYHMYTWRLIRVGNGNLSVEVWVQDIEHRKADLPSVMFTGQHSLRMAYATRSRV